MKTRSRVGAVLVASLVLAACSSGGSDEGADEKKETTTTEAAEVTTTTAADDEADEEASEEGSTPDGLPTDEADAPSGEWISVRFNVAIEPPQEGEEFNPGSAEARLYNIEPDCDDDGCTLELSGGGEDGSFSMPGTEPIEGPAVEFEPEGDEWVKEEELEPFGCTEELDGPYVDTTETRTFEPVYDDDGELTGLVGTLLITDTVNAAGEEAGCPGSINATYAYAVVAAPYDGIEATDGFEVDGTFRQTLEITESEGFTNELLQVGAISTTLPDYDIDLAGACSAAECDVVYSAINGDGDRRSMTMTSDDGIVLQGQFEESNGCTNPDTGEVVFEAGAYDSVGEYETLVPVWIEDGEVKAWVGEYTFAGTPTELGESDPSCSTPESLRGWVYLVDVDTFADL